MNVASFYRFVDIDESSSIRASLQAMCDGEGLLGTILVANEGVNGTLAGSRRSVETVLDWLAESLKLTEPIEARWTVATRAPFRRMRVRLKNEIVSTFPRMSRTSRSFR